jgi:hypothetical protein
MQHSLGFVIANLTRPNSGVTLQFAGGFSFLHINNSEHYRGVNYMQFCNFKIHFLILSFSLISSESYALGSQVFSRGF